MGICTSCYSYSGDSNATNAPTVKLILLDGQLTQFSSPIKVFLAAPPPPPLFNDEHFCSFICNAYEMDFDKYVTAMSGEEELRPGQLYFELPESWFNRRLTAEDMASLAVKAGRALMSTSSGGGNKVVRCGCWVKRVDPFVFYDDEDYDDVMTSSNWSRDDGRDMENHGHGGGGHGGGGGKRLMVTRLESIEED